MTKPKSPAEFASAVLTCVKAALESEAALNTLTADVDAITKAYVDRQPQLVMKVNAELRMVYGWASVVTKDGNDVEDLQGDVMDMDNVREVVHEFITDVRIGKAMHNGDQVGEVVDSFVMSADVQKAFGVDFGCEGWMVGMKVKSDTVWKRVLSGEFPMFSIAGPGVRTPIPAAA